MRTFPLHHLIHAVLVIALLGITGCRTVDSITKPSPESEQQLLVADRLFFGRNIPAGGSVSDAQWEEFLRDVVTPRFPEGLSVWQGRGQWLDPRGDLVKEPVFVVEVFHAPGAGIEAAITAIAEEYKKRFAQDSVLRVTSDSRVRFY